MGPDQDGHRGRSGGALRGATKLLRRFRPKVLLDAHSRPGAGALDLLLAHGYEIVSPAGGDVEADPDGITQGAAIPRPTG